MVPVAAVVVNPTFTPSRPRGVARTSFDSVKTSREAARTGRSERCTYRPEWRAILRPLEVAVRFSSHHCLCQRAWLTAREVRGMNEGSGMRMECCMEPLFRGSI